MTFMGGGMKDTRRTGCSETNHNRGGGDNYLQDCVPYHNILRELALFEIGMFRDRYGRPRVQRNSPSGWGSTEMQQKCTA